MRTVDLTAGNTSSSLIKESVAARLRAAIVGGEIEPGAPIVEVKWATRFGVAQASIRAGLNILEAEGFVERGHGRSLRVTRMTEGDVSHSFAVRVALETLGARLAAERGADVSELDQLVADMSAAVTCGNLRAFYERDLRFHLTLCRLSGNPVLEQFLQRLLVPLFAFVIMRVHETMDDQSRWLDSIAKHREIVAAIRTGDPDVAARTVAATTDYFASDIHDLTVRRTKVAQPPEH